MSNIKPAGDLDAEVVQSEAIGAIPLQGPGDSPSRAMIEAHNPTHWPAAPWSEIWGQARGKSDWHTRVKQDSEIPCVQMDFQFISGVAVWYPEAHAKATVLTMVDMDTGYVGVLVSGESPDNLMARSTASFVDKLRAEKKRLRCDNEPAIRQLPEKLARSTILEPLTRAKHQSVGGVERETAHQITQAATRALRTDIRTRGPERTLCLDTHSSSGCCGMQRGHTIGSSLKVLEAESLGKSERARATAFESLDHIQPCDHFRLRASVMKSVPKFLRGPCKNSLKVALEAAIDPDVATQCRGWKLLLMLPRMLLHKQPGSGQVSRAKLEERMAMFSRGQSCDERAAVTRRRSQRRADNDDVKRAARAEMFVHMGELSSARQALVGEAVAPGNQATYNQLTDDTRRPARPRDPLPDEILNFQPTVSFEIDEDRFCRNLRSSRRGAAAGPSGRTTEHLRPLLEDVRGMKLFSNLAAFLAKAHIPDIATQMIRVGHDSQHCPNPTGGSARDRGRRRRLSLVGPTDIHPAVSSWHSVCDGFHALHQSRV